MDDRRFDQLTRALGAATSRRQAVKTIGAGIAGGVLSLFGVSRAAANHEGGTKCRTVGDQCRANADCCERYCDSFTSTCACPAGLTCGGNSNCRDIGDQCRANADCCLGVCWTGPEQTFQCTCPPLLPDCNQHGNCREPGDNCRSSAECCSGFCDSTGHCAACPPGLTLCRGNCLPCTACQKCDSLTGTCVPDVGKACDDANACTVNDKCNAVGACVGTAVVCDDDNECTADTCDPLTGCVFTPLPGAPCETGNRCTADVCDADGQCQQGPETVTCPQCQACNPENGTCRAAFEGLPCEDGDLCTVGDQCENGTCRPGPVTTCPDTGNACTVNVCNQRSGICEIQNRPNTTSCNDNNPCTTDDVCTNGVCAGTPIAGCVLCTTASTCPTPSNQCQQTTCVNGVCGVENKPNGTGCNDNNVCTTNDTCQAGVCTGTAVTCPSPAGCCLTGPNPGTCGRPTGAACNNDNQCCSRSCPGTGSNRVCA